MDKNNPITFFEWLTLAGIFLGPILAIFVTRLIDSMRDKKTRRLDIFKTLMRTRNYRLSPDHVGALNLIEIEFYKEKNVLNALERYLEHLNNGDTNKPTWSLTMGHLLTKVLFEMAKSLNYNIDQLQILNGGYVPQGWSVAEDRQDKIQQRLLSLLNNEIPLSVSFNSGNINVPPGFPPPPPKS